MAEENENVLKAEKIEQVEAEVEEVAEAEPAIEEETVEAEPAGFGAVEDSEEAEDVEAAAAGEEPETVDEAVSVEGAAGAGDEAPAEDATPGGEPAEPEKSEEEQQLDRLQNDREALEALVEDLSGRSRRNRQLAAHSLALLSERDPELLAPYIPDLIDALYRPEAQTRWEALDALTQLTSTHARETGGAFEGAEIALFDELSAPLHLSAFRFLTVWGSSERRRSEKVWPVIDEAIQCYHGDLEYRDMLALLLDFANGEITGNVAEQLAARLQFDAENGKGAYIKARSREIYDFLVKRFRLDNPQRRSRAAKKAEEDAAASDEDDEGDEEE